jgi:hypothetical protein
MFKEDCMPPYGFSEDDYEDDYEENHYKIQTLQRFYCSIDWTKFIIPTINDYFNNKNKKVKKDYKLSNE